MSPDIPNLFHLISTSCISNDHRDDNNTRSLTSNALHQILKSNIFFIMVFLDRVFLSCIHPPYRLVNDVLNFFSHLQSTMARIYLAVKSISIENRYSETTIKAQLKNAFLPFNPSPFFTFYHRKL